MPRDADRTRRRILAAAIDEFAANGYAGARIDRIAARAEVNKRMIYHHFGGKRVLFEAVLADRLATGAPSVELVRLWMYEALERGDEDIVRLSERTALATTGIDAIRSAQARGELPPTLDAALLALARTALEVFPLAFPQLVRIVTGRRAASPEFDDAWKTFLRDWQRSGASQTPVKPRLRLDTSRVSQAARRPTVPTPLIPPR